MVPEEAYDRRQADLLALGQAVKRRREASGFTLDALAEASGVSRRMVVAIEHGARNPGVRSLFDIAGALGLLLSDLIKDAEPDDLL